MYCHPTHHRSRILFGRRANRLGQELDRVAIGDPRLKEVRMGALVDKEQCQSVVEQVRK